MPLDITTAKNSYINKSNDILTATEALSKKHYGLMEVFTSKQLKAAKAKLPEYYEWLKSFDEAYTSELRIEGALPDLNMRTAKVSIVERARNIFILSLQGYEKELANIEASTNFKLTTGIALLAVLIAVLGMIVG